MRPPSPPPPPLSPEDQLLLRARVLVIDDHPIFRDALIHLLRLTSGGLGSPFTSSQVLGMGSVENLLRLKAQPQGLRLAILDLALPGISGAEAVIALRQRLPYVPIIVVSGTEERRLIMPALHAGARAIISKALTPSALATALRRALDGSLHEGEILLGRMPSPPPASLARKLTLRQCQVLSLLSLGHTNKEIADRLEVSEITVKQHVSRIFKRVGVSNRTQAVLAARRAAMVPVEAA